MPRPEIYVSVDIEADGPIPGEYSMLSLGAAAFLRGSSEPVATFEVNLKRIMGAQEHPDTMQWWSKFPDAWAYTRRNPVNPSEGMYRLVEWANQLPGNPVLVVYPSWDAMWVTYYLTRFLPGATSPFGLAALDVKSFAMAALGNESFKGTSKKALPKEWFEGTPDHSHKAIEDAIEQGMVFMRALEHVLKPVATPGKRGPLDRTCGECDDPITVPGCDYYMLDQDLWDRIAGGDRFLHFRCASKRVGRPLGPPDLATWVRTTGGEIRHGKPGLVQDIERYMTEEPPPDANRCWTFWWAMAEPWRAAGGMNQRPVPHDLET